MRRIRKLGKKSMKELLPYWERVVKERNEKHPFRMKIACFRLVAEICIKYQVSIPSIEITPNLEKPNRRGEYDPNTKMIRLHPQKGINFKVIFHECVHHIQNEREMWWKFSASDKGKTWERQSQEFQAERVAITSILEVKNCDFFLFEEIKRFERMCRIHYTPKCLKRLLN
jgi:hypothetical protein